MTLKYPKPKRNPTKKKPPTVAEKLFMERVALLGCIITGQQGNRLTIHHVRRHGEPRNHYKILPLIDFLHLKQVGDEESIEWSLPEWEKRHGTQELLLIKVYELLLNDGGLPEPAMEIYTKLKAGTT